jgi:hexosaminidase
VAISLPATLRIETDVVNGSRVWVNGEFEGRFEVFVFGGRNTLFSWSQMALVAPLGVVEGGVESLVLEAGVGSATSDEGNGGYVGPSSESGAASFQVRSYTVLTVLALWCLVV